MSDFSMQDELIHLVEKAGKEISLLKKRFDKCDNERKELSVKVTMLEKEANINAMQIENALKMIDGIQKQIN